LLSGLPRRIPDYPDAFATWNAVSSFGSLVSVVATVLFGYIIYDLFANGPVVQTNNPWALASPTPFHAFNVLPVQS